MLIKDARSLTGYEGLSLENSPSHCDCGCVISRHNSYNEKKTSFEYDEFDYACNKCVKNIAQALTDSVIEHI